MRESKLPQRPRILEAAKRIEERFDRPTVTDAPHDWFRILKWQGRRNDQDQAVGGMVHSLLASAGRKARSK